MDRGSASEDKCSGKRVLDALRRIIISDLVEPIEYHYNVFSLQSTGVSPPRTYTASRHISTATTATPCRTRNENALVSVGKETQDSSTQRSPQNGDLSVQRPTTRPSNRRPPLHARLEIKHIHDVVSKLVVQVLVILHREIVELTLARLCQRHRASRDMMCLSEGYLRDGGACVCVRVCVCVHVSHRCLVAKSGKTRTPLRTR